MSKEGKYIWQLVFLEGGREEQARVGLVAKSKLKPYCPEIAEKILLSQPYVNTGQHELGAGKSLWLCANFVSVFRGCDIAGDRRSCSGFTAMTRRSVRNPR